MSDVKKNQSILVLTASFASFLTHRRVDNALCQLTCRLGPLPRQTESDNLNVLVDVTLPNTVGGRLCTCG